MKLRRRKKEAGLEEALSTYLARRDCRWARCWCRVCLSDTCRSRSARTWRRWWSDWTWCPSPCRAWHWVWAWTCVRRPKWAGPGEATRPRSRPCSSHSTRAPLSCPPRSGVSRRCSPPVSACRSTAEQCWLHSTARRLHSPSPPHNSTRWLSYLHKLCCFVLVDAKC